MSQAHPSDAPRQEVTVREFQPADYEGVVHVHNTLWPEHATTVEEVRWDDESFNLAKYVFKRLVAVNEAGVVVGAAEYGHSPHTFHPNKLWMDINVHPEWHRRGIGSVLFDQVWLRLEELGAVEVRAWTQEGRYDGTRFLETRGFEEKRRTWESSLDLAKFDPVDLGSEPTSLGKVVVSTWAEERSDPTAARRLHELHIELMADVPMLGEYTPLTFEEFKEWNLGSPGHIPEGYFIAKDEGEYIGECVLQQQKGLEGGLYHGLTGVREGYRRRGIATALKVIALRWAQDSGYSTVRTWNDSANQSMLSINERFGFRKEPSWISYVKETG